MNKADKDLLGDVNDIPYGTAILRIDRVNGNTVKITTTGEETLRYINNQEAVDDLVGMVRNLIDISYTGEANVKLSMKDGQINLVGIINKKETKYKGKTWQKHQKQSKWTKEQKNTSTSTGKTSWKTGTYTRTTLTPLILMRRC